MERRTTTRLTAIGAAVLSAAAPLRRLLDVLTLPSDLMEAKALLDRLLEFSLWPQGWLAYILLALSIALSIWPEAPARLIAMVPSRKIPLREACTIAYEQTRAADRFGVDPARTAAGKLQLQCYYILHDAKEANIAVWAKSAPSRKWERLPVEYLSDVCRSDDLSSSAGSGIAPSIQWYDASITRRDLRAHIKRLQATLARARAPSFPQG